MVQALQTLLIILLISISYISCVPESEYSTGESHEFLVVDRPSALKSFCAFEYPVFEKKIFGCLNLTDVFKSSFELDFYCSKLDGHITTDCTVKDANPCDLKTPTKKTIEATFAGTSSFEEYYPCQSIHDSEALKTESFTYKPAGDLNRPVLTSWPFVLGELEEENLTVKPLVEFTGGTHATTLDSLLSFASISLLFKKDKGPIAPLNGVVHKVITHSPENVEVILKNQSTNLWSVVFKGLKSTELTEGQLFIQGVPVGVALEGRPVTFHTYRDYDLTSQCPLILYTTAEKSLLADTLKNIMATYETFKGDSTLYNESSQVIDGTVRLYGCTSKFFSPI